MGRENTTRFILLGLLSHEPMSGYDMKKRMDFTISHFWPVGYGQIYPTLHALFGEGLIKKTESTASKGPPKFLYAITQEGRDSLRAWLALPIDKEYARYEILLKLFFGAQSRDADNMARIEAFESRHAENLRIMRLFKDELAGILDTDGDHFNFYLTVLFGEAVYGAYVNWAREAQTLLSARAELSKRSVSHETPEN